MSQAREERTMLGEVSGKVRVGLAAAGLAALAAGFGLGLAEGDGAARFLHAYLVGFCLVLSMSLGAFFLVAVQHAARAGWGVTVRRVGEILGANFAVLAILFLPILVPVLAGSHALYSWADPALVAEGGEGFNELIAHKRPYLNVPFFALRSAAYLLIWWWLGRWYLARSVSQDATGDPAETLAMERWSGPSLILFGVTVTFAAFDWLMSLEAEWYSTIFGLYFFAGSVIAGLAAVILMLVILQAAGRLTEWVTIEHYHDLGKLLFAFVVFWGYMGFSQYMLIWYANIPEETVWYLDRQTGGWEYVSLALLFGHLLIPFFGLLSREVKRRRGFLAFWAVWLLLFHWLDLYWMVTPSLGAARPPWGWIELAVAVGLVCLFAAGVIQVARGKSLVPLQDPRLAEAMAFENF